jgi:DNA (cytosine-5)-methyltransferase 1
VIEIFAGVDLERAGFRVTWANDWEPDKHAMYTAHFRDEELGGEHTFDLGDIFAIDRSALPRDAAIAWGSSHAPSCRLQAPVAGNCAVGNNANNARVYKLNEMDADHVGSWSKGGKTGLANCQILCVTHNRAKGNK